MQLSIFCQYRLYRLQGIFDLLVIFRGTGKCQLTPSLQATVALEIKKIDIGLCDVDL